MKSSIAVLWLIVIFLILSPSRADAGVLSAEALKHYQAGIAYVDDPNGPKWEEALKEFRAAYAETPTWKLMNNIGLCSLNLERDGEAIEAYKEYLAHGGEKDLTPKKRKQIEKDIEMLSASLVRVSIEVIPSDAALVDERRNSKGEMVVNRYPIEGGKASLGIHPGHHRIAVEAPGFVTQDWTFDADPSSTHHRCFELAPEKKPEANIAQVASKPTSTQPVSPVPPDRRTHGGVYVGLVAAGTFALTATVTGILALKKDKEFDDAETQEEKQDLKDSGKPFAVVTDIALGAAALSAGVAAYFYVSSPTVAPDKSAKSGLDLVPVAGPNTGGFVMRGSF